MKFHRLVLACAAALALCSAAARAQLTVEITGAGSNRLPVAIADFTGERIVAQALASVVRADLERSGLFRLVDAGGALADSATPPFEDLKARGADAVAGGSHVTAGDRVGTACLEVFERGRAAVGQGAAGIDQAE